MSEGSSKCCESQRPQEPQQLTAVESDILTVDDEEAISKLEDDEPKMMDWTTNTSVPTTVTAPHDHGVQDTLPHRCDGTISSAIASRQPQDDRKPLPLSTAKSRIDQQEEGPVETSSLKATPNDGDKNKSSTECCETQRQPKPQPMLLIVESAIVTVDDKEVPPKLEGAEPNNNDSTTIRRNVTPQIAVPQDHDVQDTAPPRCGTNSSVSPVASRHGEQDQKRLPLPKFEDFKKNKVQLDKDIHKNKANNVMRVTHKVPPRSTVGNGKREISQEEAPKRADLSSSLDVRQSSDRGMELAIEQRRLLYEEEAARIFQEEEARRKQQRLERQLDNWDFQLAMVNVIALAADRVVGCCVKKNYGQIDEDDDDYEDHEKAD
jgi:hypothetical protein